MEKNQKENNFLIVFTIIIWLSISILILTDNL